MYFRSVVITVASCLAAACSSSSTTQVVSGSGGTGVGGDSGVEGTGGGSADATGGASAGGSSSTSLAVNCQNYCATIQTACVSGTNVQYKSDQSCLNSCLAFAPGSLTDSSINTLGCRFSRALAAMTNPDQNCAAAGPSGGGGTCQRKCDSGLVSSM